ncbi:hypothetical protein [Paenibacillus glycanilyticus]|uniref:Uncharacterized protein n=1 Tax=Paenibacillus glycanilyticus TaxID=126569 RepID=A0ABQ6GA29_9BACL|nr:hypothetical protein [Paenibacillus glycanilyticus]GLX67809.1 hypothetical protein MU1_21540 [Paenibacillus glycanilyticus]
MRYIVILILLAYVVLLIVGGKPLAGKGWRMDLAVYIGLLTWSTFIAVGLAVDWSAASFWTSVTIVNFGLEPLRQLLQGMIGWSFE